MQHIKGPDFPTGGIILGRRGIREAYYTGHGRIEVRAKTNIEEMPNGRSRIVVTEIPYQVNKAKLVEKIAELVHDKRIEGISDIRDESDRQGMRIVIELKKDVYPQVILNTLYKHTSMQETFGVGTYRILVHRGSRKSSPCAIWCTIIWSIKRTLSPAARALTSTRRSPARIFWKVC